MSKRKGVSAEEKRHRVLQIFYEKKEVFQLKELEKIAPKEKGVIAQSVKDVVQSLADDGLIDSDKIGTSTYFWAFPSKASVTRKRKLDELNTRLTQTTKNLELIDAKLDRSKIGKEHTAERTELLDATAAEEKRAVELKAELSKLADCDPEVLEKLKKEAEIAKEATNRWTDNIFSIKSWVKNKFVLDESMINKQFNIPEDLDYVG